jgi:tRNA U34 5-carboxymethylaminomethyl modifying GTPase MnmE/TrmE
VTGRGIALLVALAALGGRPAHAQAARVWEVNGIRLEEAQVERLATDIARQTVVAVERLDGLALRTEQSQALEAIYRVVALDTYDQVVRVVNREDLADAAKEAEVKRLVIAGQEHSSTRAAEVLDAAQYATYRVWEEKQVEAFRQRGLWSSERRGRRGRR